MTAKACCDLLKLEIMRWEDSGYESGLQSSIGGTYDLRFDGMLALDGMQYCPFCGTKIEEDLDEE